MSSAVITVLLPIKDPHPQFFREAIKSIIDQTSDVWKLIIIGENGELLVLQELLGVHRAHPNISVIRNESHLLSGALNTGMRAAKTDFVCILLGDDLLARNAVEILAQNIRRYPDVDFFHSSRSVINEDSKVISKVYVSKANFSISDFIKGSPVKHLLCWRREKGLAIGGVDENLGVHGADDYDFPWSMAEAGCSFKAIPECLYYYRDHREHERLTTHIPLDVQVQELKRIFEKHGMTPREINDQIKFRKAGYLKQALFLNEDDKKRKEQDGFNPRSGWQEEYKNE